MTMWFTAIYVLMILIIAALGFASQRIEKSKKFYHKSSMHFHNDMLEGRNRLRMLNQMHQHMLEQQWQTQQMQEQMRQLDDFTTRSGWDAMNAANEAMHACDHNMNFPRF